MTHGTGISTIRTWLDRSGSWSRQIRDAIVHRAGRGGRGVVDLLFPPCCEFCGQDLEAPPTAPLLCPSCIAAFVAPRNDSERCRRCAAPLRRLSSTPLPCPYCLRRDYRFARAWVLGDYRGGLQEAILRMKQARHESLTIQMGRLIATRLAGEEWVPPCEAIVALPSHWWRRWLRGTSGPELLAQEVARGLRRPLLRHVLRCRRATAKQGTLTPAQRWQNVRGAFSARVGLLRGQRLLLVDDVLTTGATLNEATRALLAAGAAEVCVAAVARGLGDASR